tara:strand:+ start:330 stop:935 length:606 start_codon:yes stop_codon:yes gene_type:complete
MQFKNKLSPQISHAIKANTTKIQREAIAAIYEISIHTLNSILNRQRNVSEGTKNALIDLIEVAIESANANGEALTDCLTNMAKGSAIERVKALVLNCGEIEDIGFEGDYFISLVIDRKPNLNDELSPYYVVRIHKMNLYDFIEREELNLMTGNVVDVEGVHTTDDYTIDVEEVEITTDIIRAYISYSQELNIKKIVPNNFN